MFTGNFGNCGLKAARVEVKVKNNLRSSQVKFVIPSLLFRFCKCHAKNQISWQYRRVKTPPLPLYLHFPIFSNDSHHLFFYVTVLIRANVVVLYRRSLAKYRMLTVIQFGVDGMRWPSVL